MVGGQNTQNLKISTAAPPSPRPCPAPLLLIRSSKTRCMQQHTELSLADLKNGLEWFTLPFVVDAFELGRPRERKPRNKFVRDATRRRGELRYGEREREGGQPGGRTALVR